MALGTQPVIVPAIHALGQQIVGVIFSPEIDRPPFTKRLKREVASIEMLMAKRRVTASAETDERGHRVRPRTPMCADSRICILVVQRTKWFRRALLRQSPDQVERCCILRLSRHGRLRQRGI